MVAFKKYKQTIIRPLEPSYFQLRAFNYPNVLTAEDAINAFIKTRFYLWKEERHDSVHVNIEGRETTTDWNFHGLYRAETLSFADYEKTDFQGFGTYLNEKLSQEGVDQKATDEISECLSFYCKSNFEYYLLNVKDKTKVHTWTVFDFFYSGIFIDSNERILMIAEFGFD